MKISTFKDDLLELEDFARRLDLFIETEIDYVDGGLVIALTSKYGSGKTTFLEMWKSYIENRDEEDRRRSVVLLNAWESDYYGDPLFAIISGLIESLESEGKPTSALVEAAKDFGWFATAIGGQIVNKLTGVDAVAAGDLAERKKGEREEGRQKTPDSFSLYLDRKNAMRSLKKEIDRFVAKSDRRVLFLVDELDRCRPDYAIAYLETIKHIFDIKGAVFLLAADRHQLENSARTAFGMNLDFEEYYRKFIHREVTLPKITEAGYEKLASAYVPLFLEREGKRHCFMSLDHYEIERIADLIGALKLTPRQIQEVFRILGHVLSTTEENKGRLLWCLGAGSLAMAAFKVGNPRIFNLLGSKQLHPSEAVEYLNQLLKKNNTEWWFLLFLTGGGILINEGESKEDLLIKNGFFNGTDKTSIGRDLGQWISGWGRSSAGRFTEIHEKIQQISQWR